jgi:DNA processing protein
LEPERQLIMEKITQQIDLIAHLAEYDVQVVSGFAYGIDIEAHKAALNNKLSTLAVLGHGLDLIYPAAHKSIAKSMLDKRRIGHRIFEQKSVAIHLIFQRRNRIVAGLCDATVVIESAVSVEAH